MYFKAERERERGRARKRKYKLRKRRAVRDFKSSHRDYSRQ